MWRYRLEFESALLLLNPYRLWITDTYFPIFGGANRDKTHTHTNERKQIHFRSFDYTHMKQFCLSLSITRTQINRRTHTFSFMIIHTILLSIDYTHTDIFSLWILHTHTQNEYKHTWPDTLKDSVFESTELNQNGILTRIVGILSRTWKVQIEGYQKTGFEKMKWIITMENGTKLFEKSGIANITIEKSI